MTEVMHHQYLDEGNEQGRVAAMHMRIHAYFDRIFDKIVDGPLQQPTTQRAKRAEHDR